MTPLGYIANTPPFYIRESTIFRFWCPGVTPGASPRCDSEGWLCTHAHTIAYTIVTDDKSQSQQAGSQREPAPENWEKGRLPWRGRAGSGHSFHSQLTIRKTWWKGLEMSGRVGQALFYPGPNWLEGTHKTKAKLLCSLLESGAKPDHKLFFSTRSQHKLSLWIGMEVIMFGF